MRTPLKIVLFVFLVLSVTEVALRIFFPIEIISVGHGTNPEVLGWGPDVAEECDPLPENLINSTSPKVLLVGDSILNCWSFKDATEKIPGALKRRFRGTGIEVLNLSAGGWGTGQELNAYREIGKRYSPQFVFLFFTPANDVSNIVSPIGYGFGGGVVPTPRFQLDGTGNLKFFPLIKATPPKPKSILARTQIGLRLDAKINPVKPLESPLDFPDSGVFMKPAPTWVAGGWRLMKAILKEFKREVEASGAKFAVVYVPNGAPGCGARECLGYDPSPATVPMCHGKELDIFQPFLEIQKISRELDFPLIHNLNEMLVYRDAHTSIAYDCVHLTPAGSSLLAERVAEFVKTSSPRTL